MNDITNRNYKSPDSARLCMADNVHDKVCHNGVARRYGAHVRSRASRSSFYTSRNSDSLFEVVGGMKVYSDHSVF